MVQKIDGRNIVRTARNVREQAAINPKTSVGEQKSAYVNSLKSPPFPTLLILLSLGTTIIDAFSGVIAAASAGTITVVIGIIKILYMIALSVYLSKREDSYLKGLDTISTNANAVRAAKASLRSVRAIRAITITSSFFIEPIPLINLIPVDAIAILLSHFGTQDGVHNVQSALNEVGRNYTRSSKIGKITRS